jgi:hypothetical protein
MDKGREGQEHGTTGAQECGGRTRLVYLSGGLPVNFPGPPIFSAPVPLPKRGDVPANSSRFQGLIAIPEALRFFSVRGGKERDLFLQVGGMLARGDGHRDFFSIPENGDCDIFVGGQKK